MNKKITADVFYIGADDVTLDLFESQYKVPKGISYNSYVILDEKIVVMDTIDARVSKLWMDNLSNVLDGKKPDYLVVSHMEPDHSASIGLLADTYADMKIVLNKRTLPILNNFLNKDMTARCVIVDDNGTLDIGSRKLSFIFAPMIHWPEVMMTYDPQNKLLFSADAFGTFDIFEADKANWAEEARRYYFNIVGKFGGQVQQQLKKLVGIDVDTICPLHGPVLQDNLAYYINLYDVWSSYRAEDCGVTIACASIHGNTKRAAELLYKLLTEKGVKAQFFDLCRDDMSAALSAAFRYDKLVLCSSTYNGGIFSPMEDYIHRLLGKSYQNREITIIENGSWAPVSGKQIAKCFEESKNIKVSENIITIRSAVSPENVDEITRLADRLSK